MTTEPGPITLVSHLDDEVERGPLERRGTLTFLSGSQVGAMYVLDAPHTLIGRGTSADIVINDDSISRNHASLHREGARYELEDFGSTNGTYVDGNRVSGRIALHDGARVRIGACMLRFALQDALEAEAARRVYEMSVRDALTGAYNRRHFDERIASEIAFAQRHGTPLCVILCDIDHFKQVNDRYGHAVGDEAIVAVASACANGKRQSDIVGRLGGEEFAILLPETELAQATIVADRLCKAIAEHVMMAHEVQFKLTASIGIAAASVSMSSLDALMRAADQALYQAKAQGRNCTVQWSPPQAPKLAAE